MEYLGTRYGGWWVPQNMSLDENSVVYSGGIGEDMSFDVKLQSKYGCSVVCIDPTARAVQHYEQLKRYFETGNREFTGDIQPDYFAQINWERPDFSKMPYLDVGLWDTQTVMRFYKQANEQYVSQSLIEGMFSENFEEIPVNTIPNIMNELGHTRIDLLKLDIEGAEPRVIENMFAANIKPKQLLVEFDLYLKNKDKGETRRVVDWMLNNGYRVLKNDNMNITFELQA